MKHSDYASAIKKHHAYLNHQRHAWQRIVQMGKDHGCPASDCVMFFGAREPNEDCPKCRCLDGLPFGVADFFRAVINYEKHNYEAIISRDESERIANDNMTKLFRGIVPPSPQSGTQQEQELRYGTQQEQELRYGTMDSAIHD